MYKVNPIPFTVGFSPITSYILGLLWADGYINNHLDKRRGTYHQQIILKTQLKDHLYFKEIFKMTGDWACKEYPEYVSLKGQKHGAYGKISTHNKELMSFLKENGYQVKSWESADKILSKIPKHLHRFWFLGLVDGDGCFNKSKDNDLIKKIAIYSGINQDWSYLKRFLFENEIKCKITTSSSESGSRSELYFQGIYQIEKFIKLVYDKNLPIGLPRKKIIAEKFLSYLEQERVKNNDKFIFEYTNKHKSNTYSVLFKKFGIKKYIGKIKTREEAVSKRNKLFFDTFGKDGFKNFFGFEYAPESNYVSQTEG